MDTGYFAQNSGWYEMDGYDLTMGKYSFGHNLVEQHRFLEELEKVVSLIEALPGFGNYWQLLPFRLTIVAAMDHHVSLQIIYEVHSVCSSRPIVSNSNLKRLNGLRVSPVVYSIVEDSCPEVEAMCTRIAKDQKSGHQLVGPPSKY
jgi:hypothetical protein